MNIERRGPTTWRLTWYTGRDAQGKHRRRRETFHGSEAEAQKHWWDMKIQIDKGTATTPTDHTVESWMVYWLTRVKRDNLRASTYSSYADLIRYYIAPALGSIPLTKLQAAHVHDAVQEWLVQRNRQQPDRTVSRRRVRYALVVLRAGLEKAIQWDLIPHNPAKAVDMPAPIPKPPVWWTADQARHFLIVSRPARYWIVWALALLTGMRQGEILGLRWQDINWETREIHVVQQLDHDRQIFSAPKTDRGQRFLPMDRLTEDILRQHRVVQVEERLRAPRYEDWDLVVATKYGTPVRHRNVLRSFKDQIQRAKVPDIPFHALRHTHGTLLAALTHDARLIADRLGHSRASFTQDVYLHGALDAQREAVDALSRLLDWDHPETS